MPALLNIWICYAIPGGAGQLCSGAVDPGPPQPQLHCQTVGNPRQRPALGSNVPAALLPAVNLWQPPLPTGSRFLHAHAPPALHEARNHPPVPGPVSQPSCAPPLLATAEISPEERQTLCNWAVP